MIITENTILIICFITTFGFIGYKLSNLIKKTLDNYIKNISNNIKESENLKKDAIKTLNDTLNNQKELGKQIEKIQKQTEIKIKEINQQMEQKLQLTLNKMANDHKQKVEKEKEEILLNFKEKITTIISKVINDCANYLSENEKINATNKTIEKVDFKKLVK